MKTDKTTTETDTATQVPDTELLRLGRISKKEFQQELKALQPAALAMLCHKLAVTPGKDSARRLRGACQRLANHWTGNMTFDLAA